MDMILMIVTQLYDYATSVSCIHTEIVKNVCTLVYIQGLKIKDIELRKIVDTGVTVFHNKTAELIHVFPDDEKA